MKPSDTIKFENKLLIYTAFSKHYFYYRMFISKYVLEQDKVPLNPFMLFDYFLTDSVNRDLIRNANNNLVAKADELWVFGPVSNGVLAEIKIAESLNRPIKYFTIEKPHEIREIEKKDVILEPDVELLRHEL